MKDLKKICENWHSKEYIGMLIDDPNFLVWFITCNFLERNHIKMHSMTKEILKTNLKNCDRRVLSNFYK